MGGILVGVLAAVCGAHQIQDLIIVVLPVCPVQAQSTLVFFEMTRGNGKIGMTGLTSFACGLMQCVSRSGRSVRFRPDYPERRRFAR
ncbi:hypothetical protein D3C84_479090 [compost metagenome]